jgi:hypothetical protein
VPGNPVLNQIDKSAPFGWTSCSNKTSDVGRQTRKKGNPIATFIDLKGNASLLNTFDTLISTNIE